MADLYRSDICEVDISKSLVRSYAGIVLATGDCLANRFGAVLKRNGEAVDTTGAAVTGYFIRPDGDTVVCAGVADGDMVYVDLPAACYTHEGSFSLAIKVSSTEVTQTVRVVDGCIRLTQTDTLVDPGEVVPSLDELLAHIAEMEAAVEAAESVAAEAKETVEVAMDIATWAASPIVPEVTGEVATVVDACEAPAHAVVSHITAVQEGEGDPSATNIRPITGRSVVRLWHGAAYDASAEPVLTADLPEVVYGGTLDWVSGVLTVTHRFVDADSVNWKLSTNAAHRAAAIVRQAAVNACTHYPLGGTEVSYSYYRSSASQIAVQDPSLTTLEDFTAFFAAQKAAGTPVQFLIEELPENQTTIQLTPHQLTMLRGSNALWSDTGDTTVEYMADTKTYIDNKFDALYNAILAQGANV